MGGCFYGQEFAIIRLHSVYVTSNEAVYGSVAYMTTEARLFVGLKDYPAPSTVTLCSDCEDTLLGLSQDSSDKFYSYDCSESLSTVLGEITTQNYFYKNYASGRAMFFLGPGARFVIKDSELTKNTAD